jgi:Domain of unknown function (DUF6249)
MHLITKRINMKTLPLCICSMVLAATAFAQSPPPPPTPSATATATASASVSTGGTLADRIHQKIDKKVHGRHGSHGIVIDGNDKDFSDLKSDDIPEFVIPIVAITMLTVFGAPVLIVAVILYFGFSKSRMQHRTVRMLAEKGQPIPAALLAPPVPAVRQRSDMRRGVVLTMIGIGLMVWLGAVNDWEGGAWSLGLIPFLIGAGYLIVWKLEGGKKNEIPPPPPPA